MIQYHDKLMITDCKRLDNHILFIDVNAQGILELDPVGRRLLQLFPGVALAYRAACVQGLFEPGSMRYMEEDGMEFILGCSTYYRVDNKLADTGETIQHNTIKMLERLEKEYPMRSFVSGILNRHTQTWDAIGGKIRSTSLDWNVYRD